jgi:uncharacterized protein YdeI (YjbR/CyaY-like superfamily)
METLKDLPIVLFDSSQDWHSWLDEHHAQTYGLWLKLAKKASGKISISYAEALDEALCYGWIDGQKQSYDNEYWLQKFTPRGPKSVWSKINVAINVAQVEALTKEKRMHPAGLAVVEAAKQNGTWQTAYDSSALLTIPEDFQAALDKNPKANAFFATLNKTNTYAICWRIQTAKRPETRQSRIEKLIAMLNNEEKLH